MADWDTPVTALRTQYGQALAWAVAQGAANSPLLGLGLFFGDQSSSDAVVANIQTLGATIDDWATRRRGWAQAGVRDDGSSYTPDRWLAEGQGYASDLQYQTGVAGDASAWTVVLGATVQTGKDLANLGQKALDLPNSHPWLLAGAAALVLAVLLAPYARLAGK